MISGISRKSSLIKKYEDDLLKMENKRRWITEIITKVIPFETLTKPKAVICSLLEEKNYDKLPRILFTIPYGVRQILG